MDEERIYWASIEFILKDSHSDFNNYKGGFVYAFVKAKDSESALYKIKDELNNNKLIGIDFEFIKPYEEIEWEKEKDQEHFSKLFQEVSESIKILEDNYSKL